MGRRLLMPTHELGLTSTLSTRGIGIILGCALAMTFATGRRPRWLASSLLRWWLLFVACACVTVLTVLCRRQVLDEEEIKSWFVPWLGAIFAIGTAMLWYGPSDRLTAFLASKPMAYLGQISYGLYLYHLAARSIVWNLLLPGHDAWNKYARYGLRTATYVGLTIAMASFSYYVIERRFLLLKNRIR
jgi:peptidoglycan/LPS O-acetylase OafA/YrhL